MAMMMIQQTKHMSFFVAAPPITFPSERWTDRIQFTENTDLIFPSIIIICCCYVCFLFVLTGFLALTKQIAIFCCYFNSGNLKVSGCLLHNTMYAYMNFCSILQ